MDAAERAVFDALAVAAAEINATIRRYADRAVAEEREAIAALVYELTEDATVAAAIRARKS